MKFLISLSLNSVETAYSLSRMRKITDKNQPGIKTNPQSWQRARRKLARLLAFISLCSAQCVDAALIASSDISFSVASTGSTADLDPSAFVDQRNLTNNRGTIGTATSSATPLALVVDSPSIGDFSVTSAGTQSALVERTVNAGRPVDASARLEWTISFELTAGESGNLELNFDYDVQDLGLPSSLSWSLTGPDSNSGVFAGNFDTSSGSANFVGTTSQSSLISTAGLYTFTITAEVPLQSVNNTSSGESSFSNFALDFTSVPVPEPSAGALLALSLAALCSRRRSHITS